MKKKSAFLALSMVLALSAVNGFAQSAAPAPTLASTMKQIGTLVKQLSTQVNDASQNTAAAAEAGQLVTLFGEALPMTPDAITQLAADQQAAALADYQSLIQKEISYSQSLQTALLKNDNAGAAAILSSMNDTKKEGHGKYNP